jgi:hypothetical protein
VNVVKCLFHKMSRSLWLNPSLGTRGHMKYLNVSSTIPLITIYFRKSCEGRHHPDHAQWKILVQEAKMVETFLGILSSRWGAHVQKVKMEDRDTSRYFQLVSYRWWTGILLSTLGFCFPKRF